MKLIYRVNVRKKEGHQAFGHGVFFDYSTAEPLEVEDKTITRMKVKSEYLNHICLCTGFTVCLKLMLKVF